MRERKPTGRSSTGYSKNGRCWLTRADMNHRKWYQEVMNSKKKRGDRSPVNMD